MMIENLQRVVAETHALSESAVAGWLHKRGASENFRGEYKKIIGELFDQD